MQKSVSGICAVLAFLTLIDWPTISNTTVLLLLLGILPWAFPYINRLKVGEVELELRGLTNDVEAIKDNNSEPETGDELSTEATIAPTENMRRVLKAIAGGNYSFRTLTGICKDSGLKEKSLVSQLLLDGKSQGFVRDVRGRENNELWGITAQGRAAL
ncbi:MAG: hypothetical protein ABJO27_21215 [Pseudoruegeria sp.]